jgi:hypothetical protein
MAIASCRAGCSNRRSPVESHQGFPKVSHDTESQTSRFLRSDPADVTLPTSDGLTLPMSVEIANQFAFLTCFARERAPTPVVTNI